MRRGVLGAVVAALATGLVSCGGENRRERRDGSEAASNGIHACWKDAAESGRVAAQEALAPLWREPPRLKAQHEGMVFAIQTQNLALFRADSRYFFETLKRMNDGVILFQAKQERAARALADCRRSGAAGDKAVPACWEDVALAYDRLLSDAQATLDQKGAELLFRVQNMVRPLERGNLAAFPRASDQFSRALRTYSRAGSEYARSEEETFGSYQACERT